MLETVLVTSFSTWHSRQWVNTADEVLAELVATQALPSSVRLLRQLPVNTPVASELLLGAIEQFQPDLVLCCGMAETRSHLSVESCATVGNHTLHTCLNLEALTLGLLHTEISHDAGRFVCNSLYFTLLNYLQQYHRDRQALFIHVPSLTATNRPVVMADFQTILNRLTA